MPKKYYKAEEIINILRQVEVLVSQGQTAQMAVRNIGISEQTYYRWRKEYGGMRTDQYANMLQVLSENLGRNSATTPRIKIFGNKPQPVGTRRSMVLNCRKDDIGENL